MKNIIAIIMLFLIGLGMVSIVSEMPVFGGRDNPDQNEVSRRYLNKAGEETGSINVVSAIITDYRALDTLGETTVLFTTVAAIYVTILSGKKSKPEYVEKGDEDSEV
ncbi:MAG: hydrogen gas-evolving membrane-bound hydrogenase subunit E [Halanaerobiales bacterium]